MSRQPRGRSDVQLFAEIGAIDRLAAGRVERALPEGMSQAQFSVLSRMVVRGEPETPSALARAFHLTKGAMTNTLQRLEAQGCIAVSGDGSDGRRKQVTLTPAGLAAHDRALVGLRAITEGLRGAFSDQAFEAALPFLRELRSWLEETR